MIVSLIDRSFKCVIIHILIKDFQILRQRLCKISVNFNQPLGHKSARS